MITSETKLYISGSRTPGNFGATVFNELFRQNSIDAIYLPRRFTDAAALYTSAKSMGVCGFAVSNPMKRDICRYLDKIEETAERLQAVNTVKLIDGEYVGYNTDRFGFLTALDERMDGSVRPSAGLASARIYGAGGVVSAIVEVLLERGIKSIEVIARDTIKAKSQLGRLGISVRSIEETIEQGVDLTINAIPDESVWTRIDFPASRFAFDLKVAKHETVFLRNARQGGAECISGFEMATYQLEAQFEIYFGINIKRDDLRKVVRDGFL